MAMVLAMMLLVGIFAVATGTTQITDEISKFQSRETQKQAFTQLCRRTLKGLGAEAQLQLDTVSGRRGGYLSKLIIDRDPLAFSFSAMPPGASRVVLYSQSMAGGDLAVWLKYLNQEEVEAMDNGEWKGLGTDLRLLGNVSAFEWRFFNRVTGEWSNVWEPGAERPSLVDLSLGVDQETPLRHVFWIPKYEQAEQLTRGFTQTDANGGVPGEEPNGEVAPGGGIEP